MGDGGTVCVFHMITHVIRRPSMNIWWDFKITIITLVLDAYIFKWTYIITPLSFILLAGELMKIPSSKLRIQICKCIVDFYHAEPPKKHIPGNAVTCLSVAACLWEAKIDRILFQQTLKTQGLVFLTHKNKIFV